MLNNLANLIEVSSLDNIIKKHLDTIEEEKNRLLFVEKQRDLRLKKRIEEESEKEALDSETRQYEVRLSDSEKKLEKAKEHLSQAKSEQQVSAAEKEISEFTHIVEEVEEKILENLERSEKLEESIKEATTFLSGVAETIKEIQGDISTIEERENKEIAKLKKRIMALLDSTSKVFREAYMRSHRQFRFKSPLVLINNRECGRCRFHLDDDMYQMVVSGRSPVKCGGCQRLMAPPEAKEVSF